MPWPAVKRAFSPSAFKAYVDGLEWTGEFQPKWVTIHNTAAPSLAQRPDGLTFQHIKNLESYYRDQRGWNGGPHLFVDDKQIWVFNDLTKMGVHSPSWNRIALSVEMLGDFSCESFTDGRGAKVRANTVAAVAALNHKLGFTAGSFKFHVEDKKSDHDCPGKLARAERDALVDEIGAAMAAFDAPEAHVTISSTKHEHAHPADERERWVIPAADGEQPEKRPDATSYWDSFSFAKLNELADQGSRVAGWIRSVKRWFWGGIAATSTASAALSNVNGGTKNIALSLIADHPVLFILLVLGVAAIVVYLAVKMIEKHLITAANDGRYRPRSG